MSARDEVQGIADASAFALIHRDKHSPSPEELIENALNVDGITIAGHVELPTEGQAGVRRVVAMEPAFEGVIRQLL